MFWPSFISHISYMFRPTVLATFRRYCDNIKCKLRKMLLLYDTFIKERLYLCSLTPVYRSQWSCCLRRRSAAARLLRLWVRIPLGAWMSVCRECCVLSGRGLRDGLITLPEESYRLVRRCVWSRNLVNEEALAHWGLSHQKQTKKLPL